jgi:hypothetical protein
MIEVRQTEVFAAWFAGLRDRTARARITARIRRLSLGNPDDVKPVGSMGRPGGRYRKRAQDIPEPTGMSENSVRRLLDLRHSAHMWIIDDALAKMSAELSIDLRKVRPSGKAA